MNFEPQNQPVDLAREAAFTLGTVEVRPATREVVADGVHEVLEPRVMQVLVALARRRSEVVSRDALILSCWGGRVVGDDAINRCIARIRRLSETHGGFSLETIARVGYRLNEALSSSDAATVRTAPAARPHFTLRHRGLLAGMLVLVACLGFGLMFWTRPAGSPPKMAARPLSKLSIAVLPFTPLYADPEAQHLGDAIALRLADTLTSSAFDIISPARSLQYRGAAKAGAAQALQADFLIDGDVRRERGTIHVAMRIIDGHSNITVVAGTFEYPAADSDSVPDQIATQMTSLSTIARGLNTTAGWDARVVAAYFRATYLEGARKDFHGANEAAREAARIAPGNAFAQALHGFMAVDLADVVSADRKPALVAEARDAANRAIRLDPGYGDSYAVLALVTPPSDWAARENYLRQGMAVTRDAQTLQLQMIELLQNAGRFRESGAMAEKLFAGGQPHMRSLIEVINARLWQGRADVRVLISRGKMGLQYSGLGIRHSKIPWFAAKMFEEAAFHGSPADAEALMRNTAMRNLLEQDGRPTFSRIARALHYRRAADIDAVAEDCARPDDRSAEVKRTCFMALVALARLDDAFRLAAIFYPDLRGPTQRERERRWLLSQPIPAAYLSIPQMAPLRADPRFRDVVERAGLLPYWKASHRPPDFCAAEKAPVCALLES